MRFADICGHDNAIALLKNAVSSGRLGHAYLFYGPTGIGKRRVAHAFAAYLNCQSNGGVDACGVCRDCVLIERSAHENLLFIGPVDKDGNPDENGLIKVDAVREALGAVKYRAGAGKKVVVVDNAERFMPQAANAFLKTLEEPPPDSVIVLIASRPAELLPTMLSRCQRAGFKPLPFDVLRSYLAERLGFNGDLASVASRIAGGSIGEALSYLQSATAQDRVGVASRVSGITLKDADAALKMAEELSKMDDLIEMLEFLKVWYRDRAVVGAGCPELAVNAEAQRFPAEFRDLHRSYEAVSEAVVDITPPRYTNRLLTMEAMMLRLAGCSAG